MTPRETNASGAESDTVDTARSVEIEPSTRRLEQPAGDPSTLSVDIIPTRLLTIPEVHEMCALSEKTIRRAIERGELRAMKLCNRMRIAPEDLVAWQREHQVHPRDVVGNDLYRRPRARRPVTEGGMRELLQQQEHEEART